MDVSALSGLIGALPGGGVAVLAVWFALRKDNQCNALMEKMAELARVQAVGTSEVKAALDAIREAIRVGTGRS